MVQEHRQRVNDVSRAGNESVNTAAASWAFDPRINRGVSDYDIPHNFVVNSQYDLPVPPAVKTHALANTLLGGWQVGGIYTRQSGGPFTLQASARIKLFTGNSPDDRQRRSAAAQYVDAPGCTPNAITGDIGHYIMTQCFAFPALGRTGELRPEYASACLRSAIWISRCSRTKTYGARKLKAQFRVEMFNILNNTNFTAQMQTLFDGSGKLVSSVKKANRPDRQRFPSNPIRTKNSVLTCHLQA